MRQPIPEAGEFICLSSVPARRHPFGIRSFRTYGSASTSPASVFFMLPTRRDTGHEVIRSDAICLRRLGSCDLVDH
jgi:hypothetical protein